MSFINFWGPYRLPKVFWAPLEGGSRITGFSAQIRACRGRTDIRDRNKLLSVVNEDPVGENITNIISPTTPMTLFLMGFAWIAAPGLR